MTWKILRKIFCCCAAKGIDARLIAEIEEEKLHDAELEKKRVELERTEKAYLRHKHALEKESLKEVNNEFDNNYWLHFSHLLLCYRQPVNGV